MHILYHLLISAFALVLAAYFIPGIQVASLTSALVAAGVLGILNLLVRPVLFVLTLPITILTLGLFTFVINGALFWFAASFIEGFTVTNFWYALFGSVFVSVVSAVGNKLTR